jgi:uncharacterized membrane protein
MAINFFTEEQQDQMVAAIRAAEKSTSGEVKVHIELKCPDDVLERATEVFNTLEMQQTRERNGVLIYIALDDHKFAIIGDSGIHTVVPAGFWQSVKDLMRSHFIQGNFTEGICAGVQQVGEQLKAHFPYHNDDENELPDDISFGTT